MYRILVVDDEFPILEAMKVMLKDSDIPIECIETAENGWDALKLVELNIPDIIVTDIKMPVMDGMELIRYLHNKCYRTAFIIISGFDDFVYTRQAIRYGVDEYLLKPVDSDEFIDSIKRSIKKIEQINYMAYGKINPLISMFADIIWRQDKEAYSTEFLNLLKTFDKMAPSYMVKVGNDIISELKSRLSIRTGYNIDVSYDEFAGAAREEYIKWMDGYFNVLMNVVRDSKKNFNTNFVSSVKAYMEENYRNEFSLEDIAKHIGFSVTYFSQLFKTHMGQPFVQYRNEMRVNKAKELLINTNESITNIALDTGFSDSTYFIRVFKEITGMTPSEFKKNN